jgi:hypothetical protein
MLKKNYFIYLQFILTTVMFHVKKKLLKNCF